MPDLDLSCDCGAIQGTMRDVTPSAVLHVVCYCVDCRTFIRHLGRPELLNDNGGVDIVQTTPARVTFQSGQEHIRLLRLSPNGTLRWFAGCCNTPLANMMANPKQAFLGVSRRMLPGDADVHIGPEVGVQGRMAIGDTAGLDVHPRAPVGTILRAMKGLVWRRMLGEARPNAFRNHDGTPITAPIVLTLEQRNAARQGG